MRIYYITLLTFVCTAFLVALALVLQPILAPSGDQYATVSTTTALPGEFMESESLALQPALPASTNYAPVVHGATEHSLRDGFRFRRWHAYVGDGGSGARPTILLFHGAGRTGLSMIDMWQEVADQHGLILIALDGRDSNWDAARPEGHIIHDLLADAAETYPVDEDGIFLFGHSAGAIMAQMLANRVSGPWRGIGVHAGYVHPAWLHPIDNAPPIRAYLGTEDAIFSTENARIAGQMMAQSGHDYQLVLVPGHTHWFYEGGPTFAADAWDWFSTL